MHHLQSKHFRVPFFILLTLFGLSLQAQGIFPSKGDAYRDDVVPRIDIYMDVADLDQLYINPWDNTEYPATFIYTVDGEVDTVENVGVRIRGNFSRSAAKKSFKVAFNSFESGKKWKGYEKLNLNGQHNDPTVMRSKAAFDMHREMNVPAARTNHVEFWINDNFHGLYLNTEHYDENFMEHQFGSQEGNLYKCLWPATMEWAGSDASSYDYCELKQNAQTAPYSTLIDLIDALNNVPVEDRACELEQFFNVQDFLKAMAVEVMVGDWDGPFYNKNNFYLFRNPKSGRIDYIPYDLDNTFGIDWLSRDWGTRDVMDWGAHSEPRPFYFNILEIPRYAEWYQYYINKIATEIMEPSVWFLHIDSLKEKTELLAEADMFRAMDYGWSVADYNNSFDNALGGHVDYGLKPFGSTRTSSALTQINVVDIEPIANHLRHNHPVIGQDWEVSVWIEDEDPNPDVWLVWDADGTEDSLAMTDAGDWYVDREAGDDIYGVRAPAFESVTSLSFRVHVYDAAGNATRWPCAARAWTVTDPNPFLVINEVMAINDGAQLDPQGQAEDWIEIFNAGSSSINMEGLFLSDDPDFPSRWALPALSLPAGEYLQIWVDDDEDDGPNHASFQLDGDGGSVGIYGREAENLRPLHEVRYEAQTAGVSIGYINNGSGDFGPLSAATPGWSNLVTSTADPVSVGLHIWPNPAYEVLYVELSSPLTEASIHVLDMHGRRMNAEVIQGFQGWRLQVSDLAPGLYSLVLESLEGRRVERFVVMP